MMSAFQRDIQQLLGIALSEVSYMMITVRYYIIKVSYFAKSESVIVYVYVDQICHQRWSKRIFLTKNQSRIMMIFSSKNSSPINNCQIIQDYLIFLKDSLRMKASAMTRN